MPQYLIKHITAYDYEEAVSVCHNVAHLLPRDSRRHTWFSSELSVSPSPNFRTERRDFFGNRMTFFVLHEPHRHLEVVSTSHVEIDSVPDSVPVYAIRWHEARDLFPAPRGPLLDVYQFTRPSP